MTELHTVGPCNLQERWCQILLWENGAVLFFFSLWLRNDTGVERARELDNSLLLSPLRCDVNE